eukprot:CCRYP_015343-RA/>CCRYP_015343-RA protein AED:0.13 eAED:0.13 QI:185/1/1/1/1/1/2/2909/432
MNFTSHSHLLILTTLLTVVSPSLSVHAFAMSASSSPLTWEGERRTRPQPQHANTSHPIIIGYAHNVQSGKAEQAIQDGVNVIIWSFLHFDSRPIEHVPEEKEEEEEQSSSPSAQHKGIIRTDLDLNAIRTLRNKYTHVIHLAAFGGWNGPHPPASFTGEEYCEIFMEFNAAHGYLFDGIDLDYEGHDDRNAPTAKFTLITLDIMADLSTHAKRTYGMIVSMAPAESYLDATAPDGSPDAIFSLRLDLSPRAWTSSPYASEEDRALISSVGFSHAGRQCYAYVLAKAGIETFDWVSIQLYEAYSPLAHELSRRKVDPVDALMARVKRLTSGYIVRDVPGVVTSEYTVKIPLSKLVLGVANKWADGLKFCKVDASWLRSAYQSSVVEYGEGFGGIMFWTIEEEGSEPDSRFTLQLSRAFETEFDRLEHSISQEL